MKTYRMTIRETVTKVVRVKATSVEQAEEKASIGEYSFLEEGDVELQAVEDCEEEED